MPECTRATGLGIAVSVDVAGPGLIDGTEMAVDAPEQIDQHSGSCRQATGGAPAQCR
jgi:hypothetical protein